MPEEYRNKTNEIAVSSDNSHDPKIHESAYFLLSQQIVSLRDSMDTKIENLRKNLKTTYPPKD